MGEALKTAGVPKWFAGFFAILLLGWGAREWDTKRMDEQSKSILSQASQTFATKDELKEESEKRNTSIWHLTVEQEKARTATLQAIYERLSPRR